MYSIYLQVNNRSRYSKDLCFWISNPLVPTIRWSNPFFLGVQILISNFVQNEIANLLGAHIGRNLESKTGGFCVVTWYVGGARCTAAGGWLSDAQFTTDARVCANRLAEKVTSIGRRNIFDDQFSARAVDYALVFQDAKDRFIIF